MNQHAHRILLVDDDADIRLLTATALRKSLPEGAVVTVAASGEEAIEYMIGEGKFEDRAKFPFPTLIICDLNMADGDGFSVLEFLQGNPEWSLVPRIIYTSSDDEDDIRTAFLLGASAYHVKPTSAKQMEDCMRIIIEYWATSAVPPVDESGRIKKTSSTGRLGERYSQPQGGPCMRRPRRTPSELTAGTVTRVTPMLDAMPPPAATR